MNDCPSDAVILSYLKSHGGKCFYELDAHFQLSNFRELDRALQRLRRAGLARTHHNKAKYGDGYPRWEAR